MNSQNGERRINIIQARADLFVPAPGGEYRKKRVAAYARVSTDEEEQLSSYEAQVDFYTRHIKSNPEWEFVEVYTDEGISGTNTKKRDGFNRMIADALDGKIDLILTKSVSRFARNTVDTLTTVRKLKEKGIEVYFEKENIHTLDSKGELLITIMSSLAQEESRSISENVTWGKRKSMEDGKVSLPYGRFLGYEKGEDDLPKIVEEEAEIIRQIYTLFLQGQTYRSIADYLTRQEIPTPSGKNQWSVSTVMSILRNEKYKGAALLQKTYTVDFLTKTKKKNEGELVQVYIPNSHPAIIDPVTWDLAQSEMKKHTSIRRQVNNNSPFSAKIICGECGGFYGSKVWHSNDKYRTHIWRCNRKYKDGAVCSTPHIREETLKQVFMAAFNRILGSKAHYIRQFEELMPLLADTSKLEVKRDTLMTEQSGAEEQLRRCIDENARTLQDQAGYERRYAELADRITSLREQIAKVNNEILEQVNRKEKIRRFLTELQQSGDIVTEFDENIWSATVESMTVCSEKEVTVTFRDGTEVTVEIPEDK